jgi:outer membrane protein assembly factor BamB
MQYWGKKSIGLILVSFFLSSLHSQEQKHRLITHGTASILSPNAQVSDWNRFNGPFDNASSPESHLIEDWGKNGPKVIWEVIKGEGYASPAVAQGTLVLFHRENGNEIIEGLNAETGKRSWIYQYPVNYRDRYGYSNGPRSSPLIDENFIYAHGVTSWLTCLNLKTGELKWKRDLAREFEIPDYFFGKGSNPIIFEKFLILNVGGSKERCVVAFNKETGKTEWICRDSWGASYSSPTIASIHGRKVCLVLTGGESRPPSGGLLTIDPLNGDKLNRFSWRSSSYESANAVPPIPCGQNQVFLSECYEKGGVLLEYDHQFNPKIIWTDEKINIHWMTPVIKDQTLYGIAGRHQQGAETFALNLSNGEIYWKEPIVWSQSVNNRMINLGLFRGSILKLKNHFIGLSELGSLVKLNLSKEGWKIENQVQLFFAPGTWTLPALSKGLLYIMQNETDRLSGKKPRLICLDLRAQ